MMVTTKILYFLSSTFSVGGWHYNKRNVDRGVTILLYDCMAFNSTRHFFPPNIFQNCTCDICRKSISSSSSSIRSRWIRLFAAKILLKAVYLHSKFTIQQLHGGIVEHSWWSLGNFSILYLFFGLKQICWLCHLAQ